MSLSKFQAFHTRYNKVNEALRLMNPQSDDKFNMSKVASGFSELLMVKQ